MKAALSDFESGIEELVAFLGRTEKEHDLMALLNERRSVLPDNESGLVAELVRMSTSTKRYTYSVAIVSLYGLLERLVDTLVSKFVMHLGELSNTYNQLPEPIRKNHLVHSLALIDVIQKDSSRADITHEEVIANLHSCLSGGDDYALNGQAFSIHRGNLTLERISLMFSSVGVSNYLLRVARSRSFMGYFEAKFTGRDLNLFRDEDIRALFDQVDDLVGKRNLVSHGVILVDDLESVDLLRERCAFIRVYGCGLFELLSHEVLNFSAAIGVAQALGRPIEVYNNRIVCFEAACKLSVGDTIFAVTSDALVPVRSSNVMSIQVDNVDKEEISTEIPIRFGVSVGFHANESYDYYSV